MKREFKDMIVFAPYSSLNGEIKGDYDEALAVRCVNGTFVGTEDNGVASWLGIPSGCPNSDSPLCGVLVALGTNRPDRANRGRAKPVSPRNAAVRPPTRGYPKGAIVCAGSLVGFQALGPFYHAPGTEGRTPYAAIISRSSAKGNMFLARAML